MSLLSRQLQRCHLAQNVANIGTSLSAANATAAASTTSVRSGRSRRGNAGYRSGCFSDYATHYQSLNASAAVFHHSFVQTLTPPVALIRAPRRPTLGAGVGTESVIEAAHEKRTKTRCA